MTSAPTAALTAAGSVALVVLLALGGAAGPGIAAAAVLLGAVAVSLGWAPLLGLPSPRGSAVTVLAAGAVAAVGTAFTSSEPLLVTLPGVMALGLIGSFVHQLLRQDGRLRLVESVSGVIAGQAVVVFGAAWIGLVRAPSGTESLIVATAAAGVAALGFAVPVDPKLRAALGAVLGTAVGALVAGLVGGLPVLRGAVLGLGVAVMLLAVARALAERPLNGGWRALAASACAPVLAAGAIAYVLSRLLAG